MKKQITTWTAGRSCSGLLLAPKPPGTEDHPVSLERLAQAKLGRSKADATAANRIQIDSTLKDGRDFVRTAGRVDTGVWSPTTHSKVRAHEFGHLLGLPDDYRTKSGAPKPGHAGHLMAGGAPYADWRVAQHEIVDVVADPVAKSQRSQKTTFRIH